MTFVSQRIKKHGFLFVFLLVSLVWFLGFQIIYEINDNDSYFYIAMSHIYADKGFIKEMPWLYHTSWRKDFPGIHFLWSVVLIPFVKVFGDLNGTKLLQSLVVGFILGILYLIIKHIRRDHHFIFFLLFFLFPLASYFMSRFQNVRAIAFAVLFFLTGLYALLLRRNWFLFMTSFFFVWAYDGYVILVILAFLYFLSRLIVDKALDLKPFLCVISGIVWGIILNPYFPNNILNSQAIYTNPIINFAFPVSIEWTSPYFSDRHLFYILIGYLVILSFGFFFLYQEIQQKKNRQCSQWFFLWLSSVFFVFLTFLSQRFVEYSVPLIFLFLVACFHIFLPENINFRLFNRLLNRESRLLIRRSLYYLSVIIVAAFTLSIVLLIWLSEARHFDRQAFSLSRFYGAAMFLKHNSEPGDLVFLDRWDIFPYFFYYNTHNYYVVGLNGNSILPYNPRKFFYYDNLIRLGAICDRYASKCGEKLACYDKSDNALYKLLKEEFNAKFLVVDRYNLKKIQKNYNFDYLIRQSPELKKVYEDSYFEEITVYRL